MKKHLVLVAMSFLLTSLLFSQSPLRPSTGSSKPNERNPYEQKTNRDIPQSRNFFPFKAKRTKDQEKRLKPNAEDLAKYADFLRQSKTGIFRLVNDFECESDVYVIRVDDNCRNTIPGGSYYSFREKEYTTAYLSDIRLKQGLLISDGILSQNILVKLGDVALENLTLTSDGVKFLSEFVPETLNTTATKQFIEIVKGVKVGNHEYRKVIPAFENNTYAIRIIAYRGSVYRSFRGWIFDLISGDNRIDLIIAFRIVRKDADGSITILWKELDRKKSPKIEYEKKKKENKIMPASAPSNRSVANN